MQKILSVEGKSIEGNIVDVEARKVFKGKVNIEGKKIASIVVTGPAEITDKGPFILPGFIDAHTHVDDSLLSPYEFSRGSVRGGTIAAVADPHEIANVMGMDGIDYMIEESKLTPYKFFYGAPSCVPPSDFEMAGGELGPKELKKLLASPDIYHMAEFMDFDGVIDNIPKTMEKIIIAKESGKPIDGHAPLLTGEKLDKYISAGISTDHESSNLEEAREKVKKGMIIIAREGSVANDLGNIYKILDEAPDKTMLCTDEWHPNDMVSKGHMDNAVKMAINLGCDVFNVLRAACINPIKHYKLPVGYLRTGDPADFIVVDSLKTLHKKPMRVLQTYIDGQLVYDNGNVLLPPKTPEIVNKFELTEPITVDDLEICADGKEINVIQVFDKQLFTEKVIANITVNAANRLTSNPTEDILKLVAINRYQKEKPICGFVKGFGLQSGALAYSICHDSHNLICLGVTDEDMVKAINLVIKNRGGGAISDNGKTICLPLPIGGLMSDGEFDNVGERYEELQETAKKMGCKLTNPFGILSFIGVTSIPKIRITVRGIFDVGGKKVINVFANK